MPDDGLETKYAVAKAAREARQAGVSIAESKAARLLTPTVTLLAACAALGAFQLANAQKSGHSIFLALTAVPSGVAIMFFTVAALRSLDTDVRVGYYRIAEFGPGNSAKTEEFLRECIRMEILGAYWARWTEAKKKGSLMQARAWFSRGVVVLVLALVMAATTYLWV